MDIPLLSVINVASNIAVVFEMLGVTVQPFRLGNDNSSAFKLKVPFNYMSILIISDFQISENLSLSANIKHFSFFYNS
jgi:hypothetical protein